MFYASDIRVEGLDLAMGEEGFVAAMDALRNTTLQVPPPLDPVAWIADNIELSKQESSRPGPMRLNVYQRALAKYLVDPTVDEINVLKGVQTGYSRALAALLCYGIPYPAIKIMLAQPTDDDAKSYFKDTIEPRFRDVEAMRAIIRQVARGEAQDTWDEHRYANGATLYMRGAASDDSFRRVSSEWNFGDEVDADAWVSSDAKAQGEKIDLLKARGTDFWNSKLVLGSTPLLRETSRVFKRWSTSNQMKLHVRCPHCQHPQVLVWGRGKEDEPGFRWNRDETGAVTDCWYQCAGTDGNGAPLKCRIDEHEKEEMVEAGEYLATAIPDRPGQIGLQWPSWHSMSPGAAWPLLAQQWVDAQGDPGKLQVFWNNVLAEPWDDNLAGGETVAHHEAIVPYPAEVPDDVVVLTIGGDTQTNKEGNAYEQVASREVSVIGWSRHEMPRVIGHWVIPGEPGDPEADAKLDEIIDREFTKRDGTKLKVMATAVDMGGHYGDQTKLWAASRWRKRVWAIKGINNELGKHAKTVWPKKASRKEAAEQQWFMIDSQLARDIVGRKLRVRGPGGPTFPSSLPASYFQGLNAQKYHVDKKGRAYWKKKGKNTGEEWMCLAYAYAALCGLRATDRTYRDLNVAATRAGIPTLPPHDPETGEILETAYDGPDKSAESAKREVEVAERDGAVQVEAVPQKPAPPRKSDDAVGAPKEQRQGRIPGTGRKVRSSWMTR